MNGLGGLDELNGTGRDGMKGSWMGCDACVERREGIGGGVGGCLKFNVSGDVRSH